jgi:hypothetical protein
MQQTVKSSELIKKLLQPMQTVMRDALHQLDMQIDPERVEEVREIPDTQNLQAGDPGNQQTNPVAVPETSVVAGLTAVDTNNKAQETSSSNQPAFQPQAITPTTANLPSEVTQQPEPPNPQTPNQLIHLKARTTPAPEEKTSIAQTFPDTSSNKNPEPVSWQSIPEPPAITTDNAIKTEQSRQQPENTAIPLSINDANVNPGIPLVSPEAANSIDDKNASLIINSADNIQPTQATIAKSQQLENNFASIIQTTPPAGIPLRDARFQPENPEFTSKPLLQKQHMETATRMASAVEPAFEQAYQLNQDQINAQNPLPARQDAGSLVNNTFNVSVAMGNNDNTDTVDLLALEEALTDILRSSARRHGLEV